MKATLLASLASLSLILPAFAGPPPGHHGGGGPTDPASSTIINNGGAGGVGGQGGIGGQGGAGGLGGQGGTSQSNATARSRSRSASSLTVAPGAFGSGNSGGNANVNAAPGFGLPSYGGGQCGIVGFGVAISPSGGGAFGPAWESTNCRNYYIARTMLEGGKTAEGWELMSMITPEAAKVLAAHPAPVQPAAAIVPVRTFDCNKVLHDTSGRAMSYDDLTTYHHCNAVGG